MSPFTVELQEEYRCIINEHWKFLDKDYPWFEPTKCHRTELKEIKNIAFIKNFIQQSLGFIPVFFFLVEIFSTYEYPGPYRHVEKGLLILYHFLSGCTFAQMEQFIPRSSYFAIYKAFFEKRGMKLNAILNGCLSNMFSSLRFRILSAMNKNPDDFKFVTLFLDGHDTRASLSKNHDNKISYSYKFKNSGLRMQVCCDINLMILLVSNAEPCGINNDGSMLAKLDLSEIVNKQDIIVLDGGYTQYIIQACEMNKYLSLGNFVVPKRKPFNGALNDKENMFNSALSSFRSSIEHMFGELGKLFKRFDNSKPLKLPIEQQLSIQYKLAAVLFNIKRFALFGGINPENHHTQWSHERFDFPNHLNGTYFNENSAIFEQIHSEEHIRELLNVAQLQKEFLELGISNQSSTNVTGRDETNGDEIMNDTNDHYEIEKIINHRGKGHNLQYLVKWKGYSSSQNEWVKDTDICAATLKNSYHLSCR
jgi:hypothetical protein